MYVRNYGLNYRNDIVFWDNALCYWEIKRTNTQEEQPKANYVRELQRKGFR